MWLQKLLSNIWIEGAYATFSQAEREALTRFVAEAIPDFRGGGKGGHCGHQFARKAC
jgi:hypothetical protein